MARRRKAIEEGQRIRDKDTGQEGVITDVLSVMYFVTFDDGTERFYFIHDNAVEEV